MKLIVITGPDASGKDTQIAHLQEELVKKNLRSQVFSIQSSLSDFESSVDLKSVNQILDVFLLKFDPLARTLFLQSLLKNAMAKISDDLDVAIFNGSWYKYAASEVSYGVPLREWTDKANDFFLKPDLILELSVSLDHCLLRRSHWSSYESGMAKYVKSPGDSTGLELTQWFQKSVHKNLQEVLGPLTRKTINAEQSESLVMEQVISEVERIL